MDKEFEKIYHEIESSHFWHVTSRELILFFVKKYISTEKLILDIGCSSGDLLIKLKDNHYSNLYGIDSSKNAINNCKEKNLNDVQIMNASKLEFPDNHFDCIIASNIIEHIEDDNSTIIEWHKKLKPNGILIIMVPAFSWLWSTHDEKNHHFRRYSKKIFLHLLHNFNNIKVSYWNFFLFIPFCLFCIIDRVTKKYLNINQSKTISKINPFINWLIIQLLRIENSWLKKASLPIGVSLFSVSTK